MLTPPTQQELAALRMAAEAWTSQYESWLNEHELADGVTRSEAVAVIKAANPPAILALLALIDAQQKLLAEQDAQLQAAFP